VIEMIHFTESFAIFGSFNHKQIFVKHRFVKHRPVSTDIGSEFIEPVRSFSVFIKLFYLSFKSKYDYPPWLYAVESKYRTDKDLINLFREKEGMGIKIEC
jgi:hypothetical protein